MKVSEKLRQLRENNNWSQEKIAEELHISTSAYAKMERGETKLKIERLEEIAELFDIDIIELMQDDNQNFNLLISGNNGYGHYINHYHGTNNNSVETLQLMLQYKDEIINQKDKELLALHEVIDLLKEKLADRQNC